MVVAAFSLAVAWTSSQQVAEPLQRADILARVERPSVRRSERKPPQETGEATWQVLSTREVYQVAVGLLLFGALVQPAFGWQPSHFVGAASAPDSL